MLYFIKITSILYYILYVFTIAIFTGNQFHAEASLLTDYDLECMKQDLSVDENVYFKNISVEIGRISKNAQLTINMTFELLTTVGHEVSMSVSMDEIKPNGFENFFSLSFDVCHSVERDKFVMPFIRNKSNLPTKCPIWPMMRFPLCTKPPFPPMLPEISILLTYEYFYTASRKRFAVMEWYLRTIPFKY